MDALQQAREAHALFDEAESDEAGEGYAGNARTYAMVSIAESLARIATALERDPRRGTHTIGGDSGFLDPRTPPGAETDPRAAALNRELREAGISIPRGPGSPFSASNTANPDPLAAHIPPADQWPADAVAWCVEANGETFWLSYEPIWHLERTGSDVPAGIEWRRSLRVRPQTGA